MTALLGSGGCIVGPQDDFPFEPGHIDDRGDPGLDEGGGDGDYGADADADADGPPNADAEGLPDDGAFEAGDGRDSQDPEDDDGLWNGAAAPRFVIPPPGPPVHFRAPFAVADERSDDPAPPDAADDGDSEITESE